MNNNQTTRKLPDKHHATTPKCDDKFETDKKQNNTKPEGSVLTCIVQICFQKESLPLQNEEARDQIGI
jgi:hypothetical protein